MSVAMEDRLRSYSRDDINNIIDELDLDRDDFTYLAALPVQPMVFEIEGTGAAVMAAIKTLSIPVIETHSHATGVFSEAGYSPIIVLNQPEVIMDYDFISEIHAVKDCDVYLWLAYPWEDVDAPLTIYGEWLRRETYKDGFTAFNGKFRGWEDSPPTQEEDNNDSSN